MIESMNPESYPTEISRVLQSSLSSVQKHLENLEKNGIVVSRLKGKTRLYDLNPRSPFKKELTGGGQPGGGQRGRCL